EDLSLGVGDLVLQGADILAVAVDDLAVLKLAVAGGGELVARLLLSMYSRSEPTAWPQRGV
ncbi:MAG: hypothetical protein IIT41_01885, partial [Oscillospiraceae bacterium]|nr:hypothetical protein [Oscillospiraceae bacterium]